MSLFGIKTNVNQASRSKRRNLIRSLLRKASRGNAYSFIQASEHYFDLLSEYFYLIGYTDPHDRIFEISNLLAECWSYLPYTRRVSDLECFLQLQLGKRAPEGEMHFDEPHAQISQLNHDDRFLLVSREFEEWNYKAIALSLRWRKRELSNALMMLKCRLVNFRPQMLKANDQTQLLQISELLESKLSPQDTRKVEQEATRNYHILQFKADWLSYRCELIELRQRMRLTDDQIEHLKDQIHETIKLQPMERPKIGDNLINHISFTRLPSKVYRS